MLTIPKPIRTPVIMRSRLMLETVSELVAANEWRDKQVMILMRPQGDNRWRTRFFASDAPGSVDAVASGEADIAICNPGGVLGMALKGRGPYKQPIPLRSIMVIPHSTTRIRGERQDRARDLGRSEADALPAPGLAARPARPLGPPHHQPRAERLRHVARRHRELGRQGGLYRGDALPPRPPRRGRARRADAVWDEALPLFAPQSIELGMRFLAIDEPQLKSLEADGLMRAAITDEEYPGLGETVWTVDFSGWPVFCLASAPEQMIYNFCAGLDARRDRIPWYGEGPMPLAQLCKNSKDGPLYLPLHPGAERFWRERGYLS